MNTINQTEPENGEYTFAEIQAQICDMFGWLQPNILTRMAASAIARLQACYLSYPIVRDPILTEKQLRDARDHGIIFCVHTLGEILDMNLRPEEMPAREKEIHSRFLKAIREKMDTPVEWVPRRNISLADQLKLEQELWRQIKTAMQVCVLIKKMIDGATKAQNKISSSQPNKPEGQPTGPSGSNPPSGGSPPIYIPPNRQSVAPPYRNKKRR
jgi:hypothetical protein